MRMKSGEAGHDGSKGREWAFRKRPNLTDGDWPFASCQDPSYWCLSRLAVPISHQPRAGYQGTSLSWDIGNSQTQSLSPLQGPMVQHGFRGHAGLALSNQTPEVTVQ